jgi:hypothetical protein
MIMLAFPASYCSLLPDAMKTINWLDYNGRFKEDCHYIIRSQLAVFTHMTKG